MAVTIARGEQLETANEPISTRPMWIPLAMGCGLLLLACAGAVFRAGTVRDAPAPEATTSFPTVGTAANTYQPGHSSGWHVHPGVHSVVVLSGVMTVYDENCVRTEYGAGQTYLGGSKPHLVRNEAPDALDIAITFVYRSARDDHGRTVPGPSSCELR